jgi:cell division protein FtsB
VTRLAQVVFALLVAGAFATALLILPIKAWMNQRHALKSSRATLEALDRSNADLQADVDRLKTRAGITQAAREELGVVAKREKAFRILSLPVLDAAFPDDWLYPTLKTLMIERVATVGSPAAPVEPGDPAFDGGFHGRALVMAVISGWIARAGGVLRPASNFWMAETL